MMIIMMKIIFLTVNVKIFFLTVKWSVMHGHLCKHRLGDLSHSLPLPLSPHFVGSHCWHPRVLISADIYLNMRILVPARVATVPQICRGCPQNMPRTGGAWHISVIHRLPTGVAAD